jgi:hypothetical protein
MVMHKVSNATQAKPINQIELLKTASEDALAYYNKAAGTLHAAPEIILFSDFKKSSEMDKSVLNGMDKIGALGTYIFNKIYLDDRELWPEPKKDKIDITTRSLSHELVHHMRDRNGARNHFLARLFNKKIGTAIRTLEEGCAVFVDGVYQSGSETDRSRIIRAVYHDPGIYALSMLPQIYDAVKGKDRMSIVSSGEFDYKRVSRIVTNHPADQENYSWFYTTGANLAVIIYASNDFNTAKTVKKLLTTDYDGLLEEIRQSVRPCVREAIYDLFHDMKKDNIG